MDAEKFCLKVSRRENGEWYNNVEKVELPDSVLDLSRHGPKDTANNDVEMADSQAARGELSGGRSVAGHGPKPGGSKL
jgi:hypothetical protein